MTPALDSAFAAHRNATPFVMLLLLTVATVAQAHGWLPSTNVVSSDPENDVVAMTVGEVVATPGEPYQGSVALDVTLEDIPRSISEISVVSPTGAEVVLWSGSAAPPRFETSRRIAGFDPSEVIAGVWTVQVRGATERASGLRLRAFDVR